ncbi:MAG TPA: hypothetical protein VLJ59_07665 [Mycobacteriales bacterium]|nr:hypothetical protein [Mycobacteriales bacterium]
MSNAAEKFVVDRQLVEWLDHHGVHARTGDRVRLELVLHPPDQPSSPDGDEFWDAYIGRYDSDEPGLARRAKEIVRDEMGT